MAGKRPGRKLTLRWHELLDVDREKLEVDPEPPDDYARAVFGDDGDHGHLDEDGRALLTFVDDALSGPGDHALRDAAAGLLGVLGQLLPFRIQSLPFGNEGPVWFSIGWVNEDVWRTKVTHAFGLAHPEIGPEVTRHRVDSAVEQAIELSLVESKWYDAWRPGMASGSGWRTKCRLSVYGRGRILSRAPLRLNQGGKSSLEDGSWLTVTEAASKLQKDVPGLDIDKAKARVSKAASEGKFTTNGRTGRDRRIDPGSLAEWRLQQRDRGLDRQD